MRKLYQSSALCLLASVATTSVAQEKTYPFDVPRLHEEAQSAGIEHTYSGPWEYFVGGGAASFDCNNDRMPDLFLAGGQGKSRLYVNRSEQSGKLAFEESQSGIKENQLRKVTGAYPINLDNDQHTDLVVLRVGENLLLKGKGNCKFEVANRSFGFDGGRDWTTGFSAIWEDQALYPTLAIGNYVDRTAPGSPWGTCSDNQLARPEPGQNLSYEQMTALTPGFCSLSVAFTDWNNSGQPALRITNDRQYHRGGYEQLWALDPKRPPKQYLPSQGWKKLVIWGMGIAQADLNNDGRPEYALTSMGDTKLQVLDEENEDDFPVYKDIAFDRNATAHRPYQGGDNKPSTGWHAQFADLNNDGRQDLFIAKGNVEAMRDFASFDPDNLLLANNQGGFTEMGGPSGVGLNTKGRGAVIEDFNADGMLDLLVINRGQPASLFRSLGVKTDWGHKPMGNWTKIQLKNGTTNPDAIGAKILIKTGNLSQTRTVQIGGGHASGQIGFTHFGVGVAERVKVRIKWPDGDWSHEYRIFANNHVVIERGSETPAYWYLVR